MAASETGSEKSERAQEGVFTRFAARYRKWSDRNYDYLDRRMTELAIYNPFWRRFLSFFWMPFAYQSGLRLLHREGDRFHVLLPYRRPNRNWYGDMAGAALLGNAELAAGMPLFEACGGECIIVCRDLHLELQANCSSHALYIAQAEADLEEKMAVGRPFESRVRLDIHECKTGAIASQGRRIASGVAVFSLTQKRFLPRRKRPWMPI